jgi:hypothetical protein
MKQIGFHFLETKGKSTTGVMWQLLKLQPHSLVPKIGQGKDICK